jgi:hypothetical protein
MECKRDDNNLSLSLSELERNRSIGSIIYEDEEDDGVPTLVRDAQ